MADAAVSKTVVSRRASSTLASGTIRIVQEPLDMSTAYGGVLLLLLHCVSCSHIV